MIRLARVLLALALSAWPAFLSDWPTKRRPTITELLADLRSDNTEKQRDARGRLFERLPEMRRAYRELLHLLDDEQWEGHGRSFGYDVLGAIAAPEDVTMSQAVVESLGRSLLEGRFCSSRSHVCATLVEYGRHVQMVCVFFLLVLTSEMQL